MELGKPTYDDNRNGTSRGPVRPKVEKHKLAADEAVVAVKFL